MNKTINNLAEQLSWLNNNKGHSTNGPLVGFSLRDTKPSSMKLSSSIESPRKTPAIPIKSENNLSNSIHEDELENGILWDEIIDVDEPALFNKKRSPESPIDESPVKIPKHVGIPNVDLTLDSLDSINLIDDEDFDCFFDEGIETSVNDNAIAKESSCEDQNTIDFIGREIDDIQESIRSIMESEDVLDQSDLDALNELKKKRSELVKRKKALEDLQSGTMELEKKNVEPRKIDNIVPSSYDGPITNIGKELDIEIEDMLILSDPEDLANSFLDFPDEDFLNLDIDKVVELSKSDTKISVIEDSQEPERSVFTPIPPKNGIQVEQYDPWSVKQSPWSKDSFSWSKEILLQNELIFGHHNFRTNQKEIINAIMSKKDVFVTMPTGGGKSLCYQIPALLSKAITVVIEPLISLIEDQVMILKSLGVDADFIGAGQTNEMNIFRDLESSKPQIRILYITPEKIMLSDKTMRTLEKLYNNDLLHLFVIDECHCVSQWGHEFRPQYKKLSVLKSNFPQVPLLALTATATPSVKTDILDVLGLRLKRNLVCFTSSFNRINLYYEVRRKSYKTIVEDIENFIRTNYPRGSGIIYCLSKPDCEDLSYELKKVGFSCAYYHADLSTDDRSEIQHKWSSGKIQFICATVAFGMGINKPDVRFVIHHSLPKSIEGYYQEAGRAGRDGKPATCVLFFSPRDKSRLENLLHQSFRQSGSNGGEKISYQVLKTNLDRLREMVAFCDNDVDCRRTLLTEYFGEVMSSPKTHKCGMCDNCENISPVTQRAVGPIASSIIDVVGELSRSSEKSTKTTIVDFLKGRARLSSKFGTSTLFACHKDVEINCIDRVVNHLVLERILEEEYHTNTYGVVTSLKLSKLSSVSQLKNKSSGYILGFRKGQKIQRKEVKPTKKKSSNAKTLSSKANVPEIDEKEEDLRRKLNNELLDLREQIHKEESAISKGKVSSIEKLFPTSLIDEIADRLPLTREDFEKVEGVGKKKGEKYAGRFILVLSTFISNNPGLRPKIKSPHFTRRCKEIDRYKFIHN